MASVHVSQREEDDDAHGGERASKLSSGLSDDVKAEWLDDIQNIGELFYLELSEGEEEAVLAQAAAASQHMPTDHVHFQEAELITEATKKHRCSRQVEEAEPVLKKLTRRKQSPSQRRGSRKHASLQPLKDVYININPKRSGGSSSPLLEALLGIVHQPSGIGAHRVAGQEERLTVEGLVPNSPASKCGRVLIGDVLIAVDDVDVNAENIENILSCIPGPTQVRLTLETLGGNSGPGLRAKTLAPVSPLVRLLWGQETAELQLSISHIPHVVMYLSLKMDATSPQEEEDILYQYPASEASVQLKGARGIFLTLCDMLDNVTGSGIVSSTLTLDKRVVHVGYWKEGHALLVIGLPAESVPLLCLRSLVGDVVRTLKVMYRSLDSAFCRAEHKPQIDQFFCLFFQRFIQPSHLTGALLVPSPNVSGSLFLDGLSAVRWLTLPPKIKMEVDSILTEFEASDFGEMSEDFFGLRRLYGILGSCLFYKSYLIANHLAKEELLDVCLYMKHYCLLPLVSQQRVAQLVIWREVFPHQSSSATPKDTQVGGRRFLLIVGQRFLMQCVLLEKGSCMSSSGPPGPDCVYVAQVKATLLQLEALEEAMEERLSAPASPCLSCADWFLPAATSRIRLDGLTASSPILGKLSANVKSSSSASRGSSLFGERARKSSPQRSMSECGAEGHSDNGAASPAAHGLNPASARTLGGRRDSLGSDGSGSLFKVPRMAPLRMTVSERDTQETYNTTKLSSGADNTLFHYVLMEKVQGIFISPTHTEEAQLGGSIHPQLIHSFHHCCLSIRATFQQNLPVPGRWAADGPRSASWGLGPVKEHGVLFQCKAPNWTDQRKAAPTLNYWVIGRLLLEPVPQEFYVCFHDSVPEVPVEMAFRLSFGLFT
ncbi:protein inturned [Dunckerocampus dactyliophorus]|uniref:protein inturned n=1 Tax=Dunckerocampus dactyliophorus TaxID=161453 RepID=UPI0024050283|nr:protein inturned [Dunckerocampus dactyliophorus]